MHPSSLSAPPAPHPTAHSGTQAATAGPCAGAAAGVYCSPRCFGSRGADCETPLAAEPTAAADPTPGDAQARERGDADQVEHGICRHDARPIARRTDRPGASWVHDDERGGRGCAGQATEAAPVTTTIDGTTVIVRPLVTDPAAAPTRDTHRGHREPERAHYHGCRQYADRSGQPATFRRSGKVLLIIDARGTVIDQIGVNTKIWLAPTAPRPAAPVDVDHQIDQATAAVATRKRLRDSLDALQARYAAEVARPTPPTPLSAAPAPADQVAAVLAAAPRMPLGIISYRGQINYNLGDTLHFAPEILAGVAAQPAGDTEPVLAILVGPGPRPHCFVFAFADRAEANAWWDYPGNELPGQGGRLLIVADPDGPDVLQQYLAAARERLEARHGCRMRTVERLAAAEPGSEDHTLQTQFLRQDDTKVAAAQDLVDRLTARAEAAGLTVE